MRVPVPNFLLRHPSGFASPVASSPPVEPIEIFRAGTHTAMNGARLTFSASHLEETARTYDPTRHEAPLVIGHPQIDAPAYGWVKSLIVKGDSLFALPDAVEPAFAELVRQRRYSKISAAFFGPDAEDNPAPGVYSLRHVGFLGAAAPAVKGMKQAHFAAISEGVLCFGAGETPEEIRASYEAELRRLRTDANAAFCDQLQREGRLLPVHKAGMVAFMSQLEGAGTLSFSEAGVTKQMPSVEWLKTYLAQQPAVVPLGHVDMSEVPEGAFVEGLSVPQGFKVDAQGAAQRERILSYAEANKLSFTEAAFTLARADGAARR